MRTSPKSSSQRAGRLEHDEMVRYSRHLTLPEVGIRGQLALKASSVLVVGVGGLGNAAAAHLAAAGVGRVGLVDGDRVERSNLQRQFLFTEADIGRNKAEVAEERLRKLNPCVEIEALPTKLSARNALRTIRRFDIVLDATDNLPSRYLVNDACVLTGKPDVYASVLGFDGQASVFCPPEGPCYRCLFPVPPPSEEVESCEDSGVLGVLPGIMGGIQALQAVSRLLGRGSQLVGRLLVFDGLNSTFEEVRIRRDPACPMCGSKPTIRRLADYEEFCGAGRPDPELRFDVTPTELKKELDSGAAPILLDVREPYEHAICSLPHSKLIPLRALPGRLRELNPRRDIVAYCHHGRRSVRAMKLLRSKGFKCRNLKGGVEAWADEVDPLMKRY